MKTLYCADVTAMVKTSQLNMEKEEEIQGHLPGQGSSSIVKVTFKTTWFETMVVIENLCQ